MELIELDATAQRALELLTNAGVAAEPRCRKIDGVVCRRAPRNLSQNE